MFLCPRTPHNVESVSGRLTKTHGDCEQAMSASRPIVATPGENRLFSATLCGVRGRNIVWGAGELHENNIDFMKKDVKR